MDEILHLVRSVPTDLWPILITMLIGGAACVSQW